MCTYFHLILLKNSHQLTMPRFHLFHCQKDQNDHKFRRTEIPTFRSVNHIQFQGINKFQISVSQLIVYLYLKFIPKVDKLTDYSDCKSFYMWLNYSCLNIYESSIMIQHTESIKLTVVKSPRIRTVDHGGKAVK